MARTISARQKRYVKSRAEAHMTSTVKIYRVTGEPEMDPDTLILTASEDRSLVYQGKARIWSSNGNSPLVIGDDATFGQAAITVSVPLTVDVFRDDLIEIVTADGDAVWVGRYLRVIDVDGNGLSPVTRRCTCTAIVPNKGWAEQ